MVPLLTRRRHSVDVVLVVIVVVLAALAAATSAPDALAAFAAAAAATARLASATAVALVPDAVRALQARLAPLGAVAKTTGAGGGDLVVIARPAALDRNLATAALVEAGLCPLSLALDPTGVDIPASRA